jgi:hypothetical protein
MVESGDKSCWLGDKMTIVSIYKSISIRRDFSFPLYYFVPMWIGSSMKPLNVRIDTQTILDGPMSRILAVEKKKVYMINFNILQITSV